MRILKTVLKILLGIFVLYGLVGFLILPNIIKEQVVQNAQATLKRTVTLEDVDVNPYTFQVNLQRLIIHGKKGEQAFAGVRDLGVNIDPLQLIKGEINIKFIEVIAPFLRIHKNDDCTFNFSDLLVSDIETVNEESEPDVQLPAIVLDKLSIRSGKIHFLDESGSEPFSGSLEPINFNLYDFSTMKDHDNQLSLHVEIDDGASIDYRGKINSVEPLRLEGDLELKSGRLYTQWLYFKDSLGFVVADGALDASMSYTADLSTEPMQVDINKYQLGIDRLRLQDKESKEDVLKLPYLALEGSADLSSNQINVDRFAIKDFFIKVRSDETGEINWLGYLPVSDSTQESMESEQKSPWKIDVSKVKIATDALVYEDNHAKEPFVADIKHLNFNMNDIHVDEAGVNVSHFDTNVSELSLSPMISTKKWLNFKTFTLNGRLNKSNDINISLDRVDLDSLGVYALMDKTGVINFTQLSPEPSSETKESEEKSASSLNWKINTFKLSNSNVDFEDQFNAINGLTKLDRIDLEVKGLESQEQSWANSRLSFRINRSGKLLLNSKVRHTPLKAINTFDLKGLDLVSFQPYVNKKANVDVKSGKFNLDFKATVEEKKTRVIANTSISDLNLGERREGRSFFAFSKLLIKDIDLSLNPDQMKIAKVDIYNPYARIKIDENQTSNLSDLTVSDDTNNTSQETNEGLAKKKTKKTFSVLISKVNFKDGKGEFSDLSLPLPYSTDINDLNGKMIALGNIAEVKSSIDLDGVVDEYGLAKISGQVLSANPKQFTDMGLKFQNLDMTNLSPYTGKFIGYKLEKGKMNVELEYKINDSQMKGGNRVVLKQLTLGESVESEDAISAPVGLAIALLKDSEGVIDLDVPVSGNVDEPEFKIGHVVWTAFKNLIVGVATAPFRFLGDMLGISAEELEKVNFEEGKTALLPPEREKMDKLSTAFAEKEMLVLKIAGTYDGKRDLLAMQTAMVYQEALSKLEDNTTDISHIDRDDLDDLLKEIYVEHFGKEKLYALEDRIEEKDLDSKAEKELFRQQLKDELTQDQKVSQEDLAQLAKQRAESIRLYLATKGVALDRLELLESVEVQVTTEESEYIPIKLELGAK
jgi:hypothetical protein